MLIVGALVVTACAGSADDDASTPSAQETSATTFPLTVKNCGEDVRIEERPESVLTANMAGIDYMIAIGAVDKITHRAGADGRPLEGDRAMVSDRPALSDGFETPREVILGSGVDAIVGSYLYSVERAKLAEDGIAFLLPEHNCGGDSGVGTREPYESLTAVDSTYRTLEMLGKVFGAETVAAAKIAEIKGRIAAVDSDFDPGPFKTALYFLIGGHENGDVDGFAKQSMPQDFLDILGLQNALTENKLGVTISPERLIDLDPDIMIIGPLGELSRKPVEERIAFVKAIPGVSDMKAIKANNFVFTDAASGFNPAPGQAVALQDIAKQITALAAR